jgi:hypothetical protein
LNNQISFNMKKLLLFSLLLCCLANAIHAQTPKDATVAITANATTNPAKIVLTWPNPTATDLILRRRKKGQAGGAWTQLLNQTASTTGTYEDTNVELGSTYEYSIRKTANGVTARGFAHVAVLAPLVDYRGKIIIFIDSAAAEEIGLELKVFKDAMRGDGWQPVPYKTGVSATVQSVKNQIIADYNADPTNVKAVLLIGAVPVPYSGNSNWDGHPEHNGAWPADSYYGEINGNWTDINVNNTTAARAANKNIPGDGKFDQSIMPSAAELMVGRIDFSRLNTATFGATPNELLKRYFLKSARWRTKQYTVSNNAIVDDNFGYFGGESFASNGFRNAYPLVGEGNIISGDLLTGTDNASFLMGYGTGPGSYTSAGGVGASSDFAQDSINIVFSNIFGSYHGDWDYEGNPLMPSVLATKGGILSCGWAGRPNWFLQGMASGETIGYCVKETQNAQFNNEYSSNFGTGGAHVSLLGDPTTRAQIVAPVAGLSSNNTCSSVELAWGASPDTAILGYHVYRALGLDGPYNRLTTNLVTDLKWTDETPLVDTLFYQVRAIRIDHTPGGGMFYNNSIGLIERIIFVPGIAPTINILSDGILTCNNTTAVLTAIATNPTPTQFTFQWAGSSGVILSTEAMLTVSQPGVYTVTVTNSDGCTSKFSAVVVGDFNVPIVSLPPITLNCISPIVTFTFPLIPANVCYGYNGQVYEPGDSLLFFIGGVYTIPVTYKTTGCTSSLNLTVLSNTVPPTISINAPTTVLPCNNPTIILKAVTNSPNNIITWTIPQISNGPFVTVTTPGTYCVMATDVTNGCTSSTCKDIVLDSDPILTTANVIDEMPAGASNGAITVIVNSIGAYSLQWNTGATGASIFGLTAGVYTVTITDLANGCTKTSTFTVNSPSATTDLQGLVDLSLRPNPAQDYFVVKANFDRSLTMTSELYNIQGQFIDKKVSQTGENLVFEYNTTHLPSGIYWVKLMNHEGSIVRKVVVENH